MFIPESESEFVKLAFWIRPPSSRQGRQQRHRQYRHGELAMRISAHPSMAGIHVIDPADEHDDILKRALEFQKIERHGLYIVCLLYLGLQRHPIACMTLAGILAQRAKPKLDIGVPNECQLLRRAIGWLTAADHKSFSQGFGPVLEALSQVAVASEDEQSAGWDLRRKIELNERTITLVQKPIRKSKSDNTTYERYQILNKPLALVGNCNRQEAVVLVETLRAEYPWANDLLTDVETAVTLSVSSSKPWLSLPPILIVGPAGIGKTRFVRRLSELSGVPFRTVNGAGSTDNRDFAGTARGWSTSHPTRIVEILTETAVANPIVLVDEVEKSSSGYHNGRIASTLLTMLEPETRSRFFDEALATNVDLSFINWILTANETKDLGRPLLSRLRVVHMSAPPASAAPQIIKSALRDFAVRYGWPVNDLPELDSQIHAALVDAMAKGASPRNIAAMIEQVLAIEFRWRRTM